MKTSALTTLILTTLARIAVAGKKEDCMAKKYGDQYTLDAVNSFCSKTDIVVPSRYAE